MKRPILFPSILLVAVALAPPLRAQSVYGVVRLAADSSEASGVLVVLADSAGSEHARTVTGMNGRYVLRATEAGAYHLRVLRIGFRPWESAPMMLARGEAREYSPFVPDIPVTLPSLTVTAKSQCGAPSNGGGFLATLWEQATTALGATAWAMQHHRFRFRATDFVKQLDSRGDVVSVDRQDHVVFSDWPFDVLSADSLVNAGFVQLDAGGPIYFAPDAGVLFSDPFLHTHCFHVREADEAHAGLVGLAFRPVEANRPRDIEGTLWIDERSLALRTLDFQYTSLGVDIRGATAGGSIEFERLPGGAWVIHRWRIRAPIPNYVAGFEEPRLGGYKVRGGDVTAVYTADGRLIREDSAAAPRE